MGNRFGLPDLGFGVGLRTKHFAHLLEHPAGVDLFEILSENFMATEGRPMRVLERVAEQVPVVMHGVSLSIGGPAPLDLDYLATLGRLADRVGAAWVGDHVCWTGLAGHNGHDLYPMPYTEESLRRTVERVKQAQGVLGRPLVLENPSTYVRFAVDSMPEAEFMARLLDDADAAMLLDVNNVYVTCRNHGLDPHAYLDALPLDRVVQIHLAGHTDHGTHCVDTHDAPVRDEVWRLYGRVIAAAGPITTIVEWDDHIPAFAELVAETERARGVACEAPVEGDAGARTAHRRPHEARGVEGPAGPAPGQRGPSEGGSGPKQGRRGR